MSEVQQRKREYETIYVMRPGVAQSASVALADRVNELLGRHGAGLTKVENWGRRKLAYSVRKQNFGVYVYIRYAGPGSVVPDVERALRLSDDVMKYQTVKVRDVVEELQVDPSEVVFEHYDGENAPPEEEDSYAKQLGLEGRVPSFREADLDEDDLSEDVEGDVRPGMGSREDT